MTMSLQNCSGVNEKHKLACRTYIKRFEEEGSPDDILKQLSFGSPSFLWFWLGGHHPKKGFGAGSGESPYNPG
jgi:hypothetical protein